jgi:hypothetical protein
MSDVIVPLFEIYGYGYRLTLLSAMELPLYIVRNRLHEMPHFTVGWAAPCLKHRGVPQVCCNGTRHESISECMIYCAEADGHCVSIALFPLLKL